MNKRIYLEVVLCRVITEAHSVQIDEVMTQLNVISGAIPREQMPTQAITMGIGTILEARNLIMIANGSKKAGIIAKALQGPVTSAVTASAIQLYTGKAVVVLDREAASALRNLK